MTFTSFKRLEEIGIDRPSLAPEGAIYWLKLYPHMLNKRTQGFTTIRAADKCNYRLGQRIAIYLDKKLPNHKMFDAEIIHIKKIRKDDIDDKLAKGDADMTRKELFNFLDFFYKKKYGSDPELVKISMRRIKP